MKYLYRQTGVIVESSIELDSSIFTPVSAEPEVREEPARKAVRKAGTQFVKK